MNKSFYNDAVSNYLVLHCPQTSLEGYQYRMLAANRINGILPCSFRTIDGETCLYYDVTGRESLARRIGKAGISEEELKSFLYAMTVMLRSLSDYLLDEKQLLLDPEYIFYDFEKEAYCFTYYPELQEEGGMKNLFAYLADRVDPEGGEEAAIIYHLCDLADNPGFVLREELLDHEYELVNDRRFKMQDCDRKNINERKAEFGKSSQETEKTFRSRNLSADGPDRRINGSNPTYDPEEEETRDFQERQDSEFCTEKPDQRQNVTAKSSASPARILVLALVFLVGAGGLEISRFAIDMTSEQKIGVHAGMIACLAMALITAFYGTIITYRKNRKEANYEKDKAEEKRKNSMIPSVEYTSVRPKTCKSSSPITSEKGKEKMWYD